MSENSMQAADDNTKVISKEYFHIGIIFQMNYYQ